jgi:hypothetical protein
MIRRNRLIPFKLNVCVKASLPAQIVDASGNTNIIPGLVERNGLFWVENAPLLAGTNHVTLTGMDVVSNIATTNLTVICVNPGLTIDDFTYHVQVSVLTF